MMIGVCPFVYLLITSTFQFYYNKHIQFHYQKDKLQTLVLIEKTEPKSCFPRPHPSGCPWLLSLEPSHRAGGVVHSPDADLGLWGLPGQPLALCSWVSGHTSLPGGKDGRLALDVGEDSQSMADSTLEGSVKTLVRDVPGGPVVKTLRFHCRGRGLDPWSGN